MSQRRLIFCIAALMVGLVTGMLQPAKTPVWAAEPIPEEEPPDVEPPGGGFTWSAEKRFRPTIAGFQWDPVAARYYPGHVHPSTWGADFYACRNHQDDADSKAGRQTVNTYTWTISGHSQSRRSCLLHHRFPNQGPHEVRLVVSGPDAAGPFVQQVTIRDILVVSIGDSAASGEGNPDVPRANGTPARWVDARCHRSATSGPAMAAARLEDRDPHTSVTFLSFACSGASIDREWWEAIPGADAYTENRDGGPSKYVGQGVLGGYRGIEPIFDESGSPVMLPRQLDQLEQAVRCVPDAANCPNGRRRIDALIISAGINDVGFGPILTTCLREWYCADRSKSYVTGPNGDKVSLPDRFDYDAAQLGVGYGNLARELAARDLDIARTYLTEYPDPTTDDSGAPCKQIAGDIVWPAEVDEKEVKWLANAALPRLNNAVRDAAAAHGWIHVDGIADAFRGHGYCASDGARWIRTATESAIIQGPDDKTKTTGTMHPNWYGHAVYANRILAKIGADAAVVLTGAAGWQSLPVARSNGDGTVTVSNPHVGEFGAWSATANVQRLTGDFNGDGRTDLALTGGGGWNTLPVAFATAQGGFRVTNASVGAFGEWASSPSARATTGDFDGDGRTDVALTRGGGGSTMNVALSNGDGTFRVVNSSVAGFADWARDPAAQIHAGDVDGDGRSDLLLTGGAGWNTLPVARSNGDGSFTVTNRAIAGFAGWAAQAGVAVLAGDVNSDGRTDLALTGGGGWDTLPVAFSNGDGSFTVTNNVVGSFAQYASTPGVTAVSGDYDGDGSLDVALVGGSGWTSVPVASSNGNGTFTVSNADVPGFAELGASTGARTLSGDFDSDRRTDLVLVGGVGWDGMRVALSRGNGTFRGVNAAAPSFAGWASTEGATAHAARLFF